MLNRYADADLFEWPGPPHGISRPYRLCCTDRHDAEHCGHDACNLEPQLAMHHLHPFGEGRHWHLYRVLGSHVHAIEGISDVLFSTGLPDDERVGVIGNLDGPDSRVHHMYHEQRYRIDRISPRRGYHTSESRRTRTLAETYG